LDNFFNLWQHLHVLEAEFQVTSFDSGDIQEVVYHDFQSSGVFLNPLHVDAYLERILPDFLARRHEDIKSMLEVLEQGDHETIRIFGHRMKGTGGAYGLDAITDIGRSLEQAAKNQDSEGMRELLSSFLDYLERVVVVYE